MKKICISILLSMSLSSMQAMDDKITPQTDDSKTHDSKKARIEKLLKKVPEKQLREEYYSSLAHIKLLNYIIAVDAWQGELAKKELPDEIKLFNVLAAEMSKRGLPLQ